MSDTTDRKASDRRKHPRIPYGAWVEDENVESGLSFFMALNLSQGGLLLRANGQPPPIGHRVRLRLVVENESRVMSVQGEVVRYENERDFAVRFVNLDPIRHAFLEDLFSEVMNKDTDEV